MSSAVQLLPNELSALVEALRRDSKSEFVNATRDPLARDYHFQNIRMNTRLLEAFGHVASQCKAASPLLPP